jgi:hypothetical protein
MRMRYGARERSGEKIEHSGKFIGRTFVDVSKDADWKLCGMYCIR